MVASALPEDLRALVVGSVARRPALAIPERHLGLVTVEENPAARAEREEARRRAADDLDVERLVRIAGSGQPNQRPVRHDRSPLARLAIARDRAFSFYYEENLLLLQEAGFELVPFQPTLDPQLPADVDAVYIGGGYPESFATELAANVSLAAELRERAADGMTLYAECGGLLYLARTLTGFDGVRHTMSGVLPIDIAMDPSHLAIRYLEVRTRAASPLGPARTTARGQEFHQSRITECDIEPTLFDVTTSDGQRFRDGYLLEGVVASYGHLHFASNPAIAANLLRSARVS
jgi:cobyrinic acid a,c-diamide synthase